MRCFGGVTNTIELAEISHLAIEKFLPSVAHEVLRRSMPFKPLEHLGSALLFQKTASLKRTDDITKIQNVGWSILVTSVLLNVNSDDVVDCRGPRSPDPRPGEPVVLHYTDFTAGKGFNGLEHVIVP